MATEHSEISGTGRHLSQDELRLWTSFLDAGRILETELSQQLSSEFSLSHREYEVLVRIDGAGGAMRLAALARQIEASSALISQTVDRLADRGLIERRPNSEDPRGVDATLTDPGRAALSAAAGPHADLVRRLLLEPIDTNAVAVVATQLGQVADHLRSHRRGDGCDDPDCPVT